MTIPTVFTASTLPVLRQTHGTVTVTFAQGSNTKSITEVLQLGERGRKDGKGVPLWECTFLIEADEFDSGFSSPTSITPSPGDEITDANSKAWDVDTVREVGGPSVLKAFDCSRRTQRGKA